MKKKTEVGKNHKGMAELSMIMNPTISMLSGSDVNSKDLSDILILMFFFF